MDQSASEKKYSFPRATLLTLASSYTKKGKMKLFGKQWSEKDIIIGCMNGDEYSQKALYDRFSPRMFGVCLRYAPDYHTAEDILQDGFLKVFSAIATFRFEGSFEGWLRRIFVNLSIERYRKNKGVLVFEELTDNTFYLFDEEADTKLDAEELLKMVQELPHGYREIFNLYAIEGYNHAEIGEMLGISEGTSKSQLSRARNLLRKKLNEINSYYHDTVQQLEQIG